MRKVAMTKAQRLLSLKPDAKFRFALTFAMPPHATVLMPFC